MRCVSVNARTRWAPIFPHCGRVSSGTCSVSRYRTRWRLAGSWQPLLTASSPHSFRFSHFPCMARDRRRSRPQQQIQQPRCPLCGKRFSDVLRHLNHRESKCAGWFNTAAPHRTGPSPSHHYEHSIEDPMGPTILDDFSNTQQPSSPPHHQSSVRRVEFSGAAKTYGQTKTFMERFDDDEHSGLRTTNTYYPFAGKDEWELGSFLLSSGLSMRKINDFLRLKMVTTNLVPCYSTLTPLHRSRILASRFPRQRPSVAEWRCSQKSPTGKSRRSAS